MTALASRTNNLINSYRDYIAEMSNDPITGGDADAGAAAITAMESGGKTVEHNGGGVKRYSGRNGAALFRDFSYKDDPQTNNNVNLHSHRLDEDQSFASYGDFAQRSSRRKQYHYSIFRSASFRRCAIGLCVLGAIVGMSVGIAKTQQQKKDIPDWEGMLAEEQQNGMSGGLTATDQHSAPLNAKETEALYQNSAMKFHPLWFSRDKGWKGQTYDSAMDYCGSQMGGLVLCPYEAICPAGANTLPMGGEKRGAEPSGSTWVPFIDNENAWAQVGISDSWCVKHDGAPKWGVTGEGNEGITRYVVCCRATGSATVTATNPSSNSGQVEQEFSDQVSIEKYNAQWFDRTSGWEGATYTQAVSFCASKGKLVVCPYEAYCPKGVNSTPFGGVKVGFDGEQEQWAPIMNKSDEWVQVGPNNKCSTKSGITQEGSQLVTQHLLCCRIEEANAIADIASVVVGDEIKPTMPPTNKPVVDTVPFVESQPAQNPLQTSVTLDSSLSAEEKILIAETMTKFKANRYDRTNGWGGSNYYEALMFCGAKGAVVCPYEAYCPQGPSKTIVGGMAANTQWVPFINIPNGWLQIGPDETCMPYNSLNPFPPEWGLTGENKEETLHIMCCETDDPNWTPQDQISNIVVSSALSEIDKMAMDMFKPIWYGRKHGWKGGSHNDAEKFCNNIGDKAVCPSVGYCPDGKTLFNGRQPFSGEQWSPLSDGNWVLTGSVATHPSATCQMYHTLTGQPPSDMDRLPDDKKQHIMCCSKTEEGSFQENLDLIQAKMQPTWHDRSDGWIGGSHIDAINFCHKNGGKKLCPYVAYCPHGEGYQPFPGHPVDFNTETTQWAPWGEDTTTGWGTGWVLVSMKYQNSATTCMSYSDLEGGVPPWGESSDMAEAKKYILCCSV